MLRSEIKFTAKLNHFLLTRHADSAAFSRWPPKAHTDTHAKRNKRLQCKTHLTTTYFAATNLTRLVTNCMQDVVKFIILLLVDIGDVVVADANADADADTDDEMCPLFVA